MNHLTEPSPCGTPSPGSPGSRLGGQSLRRGHLSPCAVSPARAVRRTVLEARFFPGVVHCLEMEIVEVTTGLRTNSEAKPWSLTGPGPPAPQSVQPQVLRLHCPRPWSPWPRLPPPASPSRRPWPPSCRPGRPSSARCSGTCRPPSSARARWPAASRSTARTWSARRLRCRSCASASTASASRQSSGQGPRGWGGLASLPEAPKWDFCRQH